MWEAFRARVPARRAVVQAAQPRAAHPTRRRRAHRRHDDPGAARGRRRGRTRSTARVTVRSRRSSPRSSRNFGDLVGGEFDVLDYAEHAIGKGADAQAVAYVETVAGGASHALGSRHRSEHHHGVAARRARRPSNASVADPVGARRAREVTARPNGRRVGVGTGTSASRRRSALLVAPICLVVGVGVGLLRRRATGASRPTCGPRPSGHRSSRGSWTRHPEPQPGADVVSRARRRRRRRLPDAAPGQGRRSRPGIFHVPGGRFYERTDAPTACYPNAESAEADGYRPSKS